MLIETNIFYQIIKGLFMNRINLRIMLAMFVLALFTLTSIAFAAEQTKKAEIKISTVKVEDKAKIETIITLLKGVTDANFKMDDKTLEVQYNPEEISCEMIMYTLTSIGYNNNLVKVNDTSSN
jgi:hypothetical protein